MRWLFLLQQTPYRNSLAREALDMALACAAFEQTVQIIFLDDGVYQLLAQQNTGHMQQKNIAKTLAALAIYDISAVYVARSSLLARGLENQPLCIDYQAVDDKAIKALIADADHVMSF